MPRRPATPPPLSNLVVISDIHAGCRVGLCPPEPVPLDGGGCYSASPAQLLMWDAWREFWDVAVPEFCHGEPFALCVNGDAMDGRHHGSVTQISQNLADQQTIAELLLAPVVARATAYYHIRGTEAHVGPSGENEELLAKRLGAVPDSSGHHARWAIWFRLRHALIHITHHIGTTGSTHYESSALMRELGEQFVEAGRWGHEPPSVIIRSHRHRCAEVRVPARTGHYAWCCTTAGWQLRTPFAAKLPGGRNSEPQIGGMVVRVGDHDIYTRHFVRGIGRDTEVDLAELSP